MTSEAVAVVPRLNLAPPAPLEVTSSSSVTSPSEPSLSNTNKNSISDPTYGPEIAALPEAVEIQSHTAAVQRTAAEARQHVTGVSNSTSPPSTNWGWVSLAWILALLMFLVGTSLGVTDPYFDPEGGELTVGERVRVFVFLLLPTLVAALVTMTVVILDFRAKRKASQAEESKTTESGNINSQVTNVPVPTPAVEDTADARRRADGLSIQVSRRGGDEPERTINSRPNTLTSASSSGSSVGTPSPVAPRELIHVPKLHGLPILPKSALNAARVLKWPMVRVLDLSSLPGVEVEHVEAILQSNPNAVGRLSKLKLSRLGLTRLPRNLGLLSNLVTLDLSRNQLQDLEPGEVIWPALTALSSLDVSKNQLTSLSPSLNACVSLKNLIVSTNNLTALPSELFTLPGLEILNVNTNSIVEFPTNIYQLQSLKTLSANHNRITALPETLGLLPHLSTLHLCSNRLIGLPTSLENVTSLFDLAICCNRTIAHIPDLSSSYEIKYLRLHNNSFSTFPGWILRLPNLRHFYVGGNPNQDTVPHLPPADSNEEWSDSFDDDEDLTDQENDTSAANEAALPTHPGRGKSRRSHPETRTHLRPWRFHPKEAELFSNEPGPPSLAQLCGDVILDNLDLDVCTYDRTNLVEDLVDWLDHAPIPCACCGRAFVSPPFVTLYFAGFGSAQNIPYAVKLYWRCAESWDRTVIRLGLSHEHQAQHANIHP